jgi:hypothetical protein
LGRTLVLAKAALLIRIQGILQCRRFTFDFLRLATLADQLVGSGHARLQKNFLVNKKLLKIAYPEPIIEAIASLPDGLSIVALNKSSCLLGNSGLFYHSPYSSSRSFLGNFPNEFTLQFDIKTILDL